MAKSQSYPETVPAEFTADDTQEAYRSGWNHGHGIACHNVPDLDDEMFTEDLGHVTVDRDNVREVHAANCYSAADMSRQYSPFEFTAHEFNRSGDGGFHIANRNSDNSEIMFDTLEDAERAALAEGFALIREYIWEASVYFVEWSTDNLQKFGEFMDVHSQVYATRQDAMSAVRSVDSVFAVIDEVSSSEELWEAFERGTSDSIQADLETYTDDDYGIEDEESAEDDDSDC